MRMGRRAFQPANACLFSQRVVSFHSVLCNGCMETVWQLSTRFSSQQAKLSFNAKSSKPKLNPHRHGHFQLHVKGKGEMYRKCIEDPSYSGFTQEYGCFYGLD
jgi:hypothetical protein